MSELVIGLTIVAFGTSTPELVVNLYASFQGSADLAIGNVVGSNIFNILVILGISSLIYPLTVQTFTVLREIPFSLLGAIVLLIMANDFLLDGNAQDLISRADALVLLGFFSIFVYYSFIIARSVSETPEVTIMERSTLRSILMVAGGLTGLTLGKWMVDSAVQMARVMGMSESVIGLTILAIGTSIPELATSVTAALRRKATLLLAMWWAVTSSIFSLFWESAALLGHYLSVPAPTEICWSCYCPPACFSFWFIFIKETIATLARYYFHPYVCILSGFSFIRTGCF